MANKGDIFVLKRKLSKDEVKKNNVRQIGILIEEPSIHVRAWIDNKQIYTGTEKNKYVISLNQNTLDKELTLEYKVMDNNSFSSLQKIYYIDEYDYVPSTIKSDYLDVFIGGFMLLLGMTAFILTIFKKDKFYYRVFLTGCFLICLSGWVISSNKSFMIFSESHVIKNLLKYYSIFYGIPIFGSLLKSFVIDKKRKNYLNKFILASTIFIIISTIISIIDESMLLTLLTIIEILGLIIIIGGSIFIKMDFNKQSSSEKMILYSFSILGISMCYEAVRYIICFFIGKHYTSSLIMKLGLAIFLFILIDAYIINALDLLKEYSKKTELSAKAYTDVLTGLVNRSCVMEEIDKIKSDKIIEYSILNFDLNDLKKINDTHGHAAGDCYLCTFSNILKKYLGDTFDIVGRTGGDEFIAISKSYIKKEKLDKTISKISSDVLNQYRKEYGIKATFAYGYATSNKKSTLNIDEAYSLADKMMYECKKRQKNSKQ